MLMLYLQFLAVISFGMLLGTAVEYGMFKTINRRARSYARGIKNFMVTGGITRHIHTHRAHGLGRRRA